MRVQLPIDVPVTHTPQLTKLQFLRRMTPAERIAAREAAKTDPVLDDAQRLLDLAQDVRVDDPDTILFVNYMAQQGIIAPERVADILAEAPVAPAVT